MSDVRYPPDPIKGHWQRVFGPSPPWEYPPNQLRGSFHLAVEVDKCDKIWERIQTYTRKGTLGYMSSISPSPLQCARDFLLDKHIISIHTMHPRKEQTKQNLKDLGLFSLAYKYDLIKKFRENRDYVEYYYGFEELFPEMLLSTF